MATERSGSRFFRSKAVLIALIILVVVVLGLVGLQVWRLIATSPAPDDNGTADGSSNELVMQATKVADRATNLAQKGDYDGAYKVLDYELATTSSNEEKYVLIMTKSDVAKSNPAQGIQQAIDYAIEADAQTQTYKSAAAVARLYVDAGDKLNAISWYEKTVERYRAILAAAPPEDGSEAGKGNPQQGQDDGVVKYYQTLIDELRQ